jgi:hypothetical protein
MLQSREAGVVTSTLKMPAKQIGAVYLVNYKCFDAVVLR